VRIGIVERQPERAAIGNAAIVPDLADQPRGQLLELAFVLQGQELLMVAGQIA